MAYSQDFRQMILGKLEAGHSYRDLVYEYGISSTTIQNWKKQPERKKVLTRRRKIDLEALRRDVEQYPDDYQRERAVRFNCTQEAIRKALERLKISQKKDLETSASKS